MFEGKPIIGLAGGIGSGKTFVAQLFGQQGALVLSADDQVRQAYRDPEVLSQLRQWWGPEVIDADGQLNRAVVARRVFNDPAELRRLEELLHPIVLRERDRSMFAVARDPKVLAFIWDIPLLFETGLNERCDAVIFVDAPLDMREARVINSRGWDDTELSQRENLQMPLDKKRELSDDVVHNTADAEFARSQVREIFSRIVTGSPRRSTSA